MQKPAFSMEYGEGIVVSFEVLLGVKMPRKSLILATSITTTYTVAKTTFHKLGIRLCNPNLSLTKDHDFN
jgi:hypothetical protein